MFHFLLPFFATSQPRDFNSKTACSYLKKKEKLNSTPNSKQIIVKNKQGKIKCILLPISL